MCKQSVKCGIFSATFPQEAFEIMDKFLRNPIKIVIPPEEITLKGIKQYHVDCEDVWLYCLSILYMLSAPQLCLSHSLSLTCSNDYNNTFLTPFIPPHQHRFKLDTLCDLFDALSVSQTVIFVNSRRTADWLYDQMRQREFPVAITHAQMPAAERAAVLAGTGIHGVFLCLALL